MQVTSRDDSEMYILKLRDVFLQKNIFSWNFSITNNLKTIRTFHINILYYKLNTKINNLNKQFFK